MDDKSGIISVAENFAESKDVASQESSLVTSEFVKYETKADDPDDSTSEWAVMHLAHLLGITEHENLKFLGTLPGLPDELFSNLSFLMSLGFTEQQLFETISIHPSLMSIDLTKSLSSVMKWLQKVELDASYLRQVLIAQSGLVPILGKKALQERIKALRKLDIPDQEIGILLKRLGCLLLERFLTLPVEVIEPRYTYIRDDIGLRSSETNRLITNFPNVLLRDIEQDFAKKLMILKQVLEDSMKVKKVFMHFPELLARKIDALEETLLCLKTLVTNTKNLSEIIEENPSIMTHRKSGIEQVSVFLQSLGFDSKTSVTLIAREPYLVECGSERLNKHVEFLKSKNMNENTIRILLEKSTGMFFKSLDKRVAPKIDFLENQGITGESLQKYMKSRPQVCDRSLRKSLNPNVDFLLSLGFKKDSSSMKSALKDILPHSCKNMQARVDYIIGLGIDAADVHKMVRETPSILVTSDALLKRRVDFLTKVLKRPVQDLVKCPAFLVSNINKVIMPRLRVLEWLSSKGLLKKFSLSTLVETDDKQFLRKFVRLHPEALSIYKSPSQASS
ncbi:hypothetical protein KP509_05G060600 [Ceratopteris richardii]|nr:hypothetical protein KP509_05G060600 [Ceratopteris richardii]